MSVRSIAYRSFLGSKLLPFGLSSLSSLTAKAKTFRIWIFFPDRAELPSYGKD